MKTGTLRDTAAVVGYVRDVSVKTFVVVGMANDTYAAKVRPAFDAKLHRIASGSRTNVLAKPADLTN